MYHPHIGVYMDRLYVLISDWNAPFAQTLIFHNIHLLYTLNLVVIYTIKHGF